MRRSPGASAKKIGTSSHMPSTKTAGSLDLYSSGIKVSCCVDWAKTILGYLWNDMSCGDLLNSSWVVGNIFKDNFNLLEKIAVGSMLVFTSAWYTCPFATSTGWWWMAVCRFEFESLVGFILCVRRSGACYCVLVFKEVMYDVIFAGGWVFDGRMSCSIIGMSDCGRGVQIWYIPLF